MRLYNSAAHATGRAGSRRRDAFEDPVIYTTLRSQYGESRATVTNTRVEQNTRGKLRISLLRRLYMMHLYNHLTEISHKLSKAPS